MKTTDLEVPEGGYRSFRHNSDGKSQDRDKLGIYKGECCIRKMCSRCQLYNAYTVALELLFIEDKGKLTRGIVKN